jgi:hypothetical protein
MILPDFNAYPALSFKPFNALGAADDALDLQKKVSLLPGEIQTAKDEASAKHSVFQDAEVARAAAEIESLDPDQRASAWDQKFTDLANKGNPVARQYIGRYSDERLGSVKSIFSGEASKKASSAVQSKLENNPQIYDAVTRMDPTLRQKVLGNIDKAWESLNRAKTPDDLKAEIKLLQEGGMQMPPQLAGLNLDDPNQYRQNYAAIYKYLSGLSPYRDAMKQADTESALGLNVKQPHKYINAGDGMIFDENDQKYITPPHKYRTVAPDATVFDDATGKPVLHAPKTFDPNSGGRGMSGLNLTDEQKDALSQALANGQLDPARLNSRTAPILADQFLKNPNLNMVNATGEATLKRNANYQRTIQVAEALPKVLENLRVAGKKLKYSDFDWAGAVQAWKNKRLNDPDFISYMTQRNDALLSIANVMRGVGMSDKATEMEEAASNPYMSPRAVDAYVDAQQKSLAPRLVQYRKHALGDILNNPMASSDRTIVRTGKDKQGRHVIQYSDGSLDYGNPEQ